MMHEVADESSVALQGMKLGPLGRCSGVVFIWLRCFTTRGQD